MEESPSLDLDPELKELRFGRLAFFMRLFVDGFFSTSSRPSKMISVGRCSGGLGCDGGINLPALFLLAPFATLSNRQPEHRDSALIMALSKEETVPKDDCDEK